METNILNRGIDQDLFRKFRSASRRDGPLRPLRTVAAYYQSALDDMLTYDTAQRRSIF